MPIGFGEQWGYMTTGKIKLAVGMKDNRTKE